MIDMTNFKKSVKWYDFALSHFRNSSFPHFHNLTISQSHNFSDF